jgi:hypothetical protein
MKESEIDLISKYLSKNVTQQAGCDWCSQPSIQLLKSDIYLTEDRQTVDGFEWLVCIYEGKTVLL